ncbi:MAG TPA: hypothetical protein VMX94_07245 [Armatimonadota bacterium]|nr:hypothetical protein [Armatimonadota bacterium]
MKTDLLKGQKGFTIIEAVISAALLCMVLVGTLILLVSMLNMWARGASGTSANTYAGLAMRKLVLEIEEGTSAEALDMATDPDTGTVYGTQLQVTFPYYSTSLGAYVRTQPGSTAIYYLSGTTGSESTGTDLWRSVGGTKTKLAKNVESITFVVTNGRLVRINLTGRDVAGGCISPNFLQQSVKLRNS